MHSQGSSLANVHRQAGCVAQNKHLRQYIKSLNKKIRIHEKQSAKAALSGEEENDDGREAEEEDDEEHEEEEDEGEEEGEEEDGDGARHEDAGNEEPRQVRPQRRAISPQEEARLKARLLLARPLIMDGIKNAGRTNVSCDGALAAPGVVIPGLESISHKLRAHQLDGIVRYERAMRKHKGVIILADDLEIGRTWIILGVIQRSVNEANRTGRSVLFGLALPRHIISTWKKQLAMSSTLRVADYDDKKVKAMSAAEIKQAYDVIIMPTGCLSRDYGTILHIYNSRQARKEGLEDKIKEKISKLPNGTALVDADHEIPDFLLFSLDLDQLIVDEAQCIKDPNSVLAQALHAMSANGRAALPGVPLQNNVNEFGALLMFLRIEPFCNLPLFRACFTNKRKGGKKLEPSTKLNNIRNDAILSAIRSSLCIRRTADQDFDGDPITAQPIISTARTVIIKQSSAGREFQLQTRDIWDKNWKKDILKKAKQARDTMDPLSEEYRKRMDAVAELPVRSPSDILRDVLHARLNVIHPALKDAKYSVDVYSPEEFARGVMAPGINPNDIEIPNQRSTNLKRCKKLTQQQAALLSKRRLEFLNDYRKNISGAGWRSDRICGVVEDVVEVLKQHKEGAAKLPKSKRHEFVASHKILVFCEFLAGLDLISIGLEQSGIKHSRFDGSLSEEQRDMARNRFEEVGKDFTLPDTRPDENLVMLVTTKTGSEGLTLIHGTDVMLVSPIWNPYTEDQIISRELRLGQVHPVTVHHFSSDDSIEERVHFAMETKRFAVEQVLSDKIILKHRHALVTANNDDLLEMLGYGRCKNAMATGKLFL
ncbi:uncharacterized protein RCC_08377 [Ramularia collo-cygni]|uniref:Helicase C-terminal domain-containing protein n=1 Tax=Ramularia collo-cygni TaxID=112498 RepID=A0A2D3VCF5_9PEZI|nr:uncharacterized protein RCC_08377 [Ramularia collo-cygni]CZT22672.1 uncharacterized protein RCC_08377 [Ramularia collo-cygni]